MNITSTKDVEGVIANLRHLSRQWQPIVEESKRARSQARWCVAGRIGYNPRGPAKERKQDKEDTDAILDAIVEGEDVPERLHRALEDTRDLVNMYWTIHIMWTGKKKDCEKELVHTAQQLPVYEHVRDNMPGFGPKSLGKIIGEIGRPLTDFPTFGKLKYFCGVAPPHVLKDNFNRQARTLLWQAASAVERQPGGNGVLRQAYDWRKQHEREKNDNGENRDYALKKARKIEERAEKKGVKPTQLHSQYETYTQGVIPDSQIRSRGLREVMQAILRELYENW